MDRKIDCVALFVSLAFHGLLALLPWSEKPRPLAKSSISATPIFIIDASELSAPTAVDSPPLPADTSSPTSSTAPSISPPVAIQVDPPGDLTSDTLIIETSDSLIDESAPEIPPDANLTPEDLVTETSDEPVDGTKPETPADSTLTPEDLVTETNNDSINEPEPEANHDSDIDPLATASVVPPKPTSVEPADETEIAADWENLIAHLQRQNEGFESFTLFDIFNFFGEPEQINQFFNENNQPKLDVSSFYLFPEQTPEEILQTVVMPEVTRNPNFDLQPEENFSAGLAYQLLQGEVRRYLILVQLNEQSGSVLMLSDSLPELETEKPST